MGLPLTILTKYAVNAMPVTMPKLTPRASKAVCCHSIEVVGIGFSLRLIFPNRSGLTRSTADGKKQTIHFHIEK